MNIHELLRQLIYFCINEIKSKYKGMKEENYLQQLYNN